MKYVTLALMGIGLAISSSIALGQTPEQVIAMKGQPTNKVAFPTKTVLIYPDMKITFKNGKLTDVQ